MSTTAHEIDTRRPVLPDVLAEHLEELAFLSIQRRKLLFSHEITAADLAEHDERITAHWDGLALAGRPAVDLALERLAEPDPWEVHAAARVWLVLGDAPSDDVEARIGGADPELESAWREALRRVPPETVARVLPDPLLAQGSPQVRAALVDARGWHGSLPASRVPELVASEHAPVRRGLARALGCAGTRVAGAREMLRILGDDADVGVRRTARWSLALLDPQAAPLRCRLTLEAGTADAFDVRMLGWLGTAQDLGILRGLLASDALRAPAALALGDLGQVGAIPTLREALAGTDEVAATAAREALLTLAGTDADEALDAFSAEADPRQRVLRGLALPWAGDPDAEPMEFRWRSSIVAADGPAELRREVPDGFFTALPEPTAVPGE